MDSKLDNTIDQTLLRQGSVSKSFSFNNIIYLITFHYNKPSTKQYTIEISSELNPNFFEKEFSIELLLKENPKFAVFDDEIKLITFIIESIESESIKLEFCSDSLLFIIQQPISKTLNVTYSLKLLSKKYDQEGLLKNLVQQFNLLKSKMTAIQECTQQQLSFRNDFSRFQNVYECNKLDQQKEMVNFNGQVSKMNDKLDFAIKTMDLLKDELSCLQLKVNQKENVLRTSFVPESTKDFVLLNDNMTLKYISSNGYGTTFVCKDKIPDYGCWEVQFKIDITDERCEMVCGFVLGGTPRDEEGMFKVNHWSFDLHEGVYFDGDKNNDAEERISFSENCRPLSGDVISLCIDLDQNLFYIKLNSELVTIKKKLLKLDSTRKGNLFPYFGMGHEGDQVTLV